MKPVITASLNQQPYFFEQDAFTHLEGYLRSADETLALNPDREEVLRDLEQAIAERCQQGLKTGAGVITLAILVPVLEEIGPVTDPTNTRPDPATTTSTGPSDAYATGAEHSTSGAHGRAHAARPPLEQISEGALLSGVCMGLSRYFGIDVSLLRIAAIVLALVSAGLAIGLYLFLMFLLPYAPVNLDAPPMGRWPRKIRGWVERIRSRLTGVLS
jgi:phage shock protein PspC (stress-responsive transcriptional regulator)